jgi:hypothetical protein
MEGLLSGEHPFVAENMVKKSRSHRRKNHSTAASRGESSGATGDAASGAATVAGAGDGERRG